MALRRWPEMLPGWIATLPEREGKMREARHSAHEIVKKLLERELPERARTSLARLAQTEALVGDRERAVADAGEAFTFGPEPRAVIALALSGHVAEAKRLAKLGLRPSARVAVSTPVDAVIAIAENQPLKAIEMLKDSESGVRVAGGFAIYLRGLAYLKAGLPQKAAAEFERLGQPGHPEQRMVGDSPVVPLSCLGMARAYAQMHDLPRARDAYLKFFAMWQHADPDLPVMIQARQEFSALH